MKLNRGMTIYQAKDFARELAQDPSTDEGQMCRALLIELCRLDGSCCEAWWFCEDEGCTDGPNCA